MPQINKNAFIQARITITHARTAREVMHLLRRIRKLTQVEVQYPALSHEWIPFTNPGVENNMDIQAQIDKLDAAAKLGMPSEANPSKTYYVGPATDELPDDGFLNYVVVATVEDLANVPDRSVLLFKPTEYRVLECLVKYADVFDAELFHIIGVPRAEYTPQWDELVWSLTKVSYGPFVSELSIADQTRQQLALSNETAHNKEKRQFTRADGSVKKHEALVLEDDSDLEDGDA